MAFPYYPAYQPYGGYYPQNQQQNQVIPASGIIWVSGAQEAQMYPVAPNNAVALWEQSGKTIFLKSADATGKPTLRVYDLVERSETPQNGKEEAPDKKVIYATKDDLGELFGAIKGLTGDIEQMKSDLYGMAGRKKSVKKTEVVEDDE